MSTRAMRFIATSSGHNYLADPAPNYDANRHVIAVRAGLAPLRRRAGDGSCAHSALGVQEARGPKRVPAATFYFAV
jgi:hypothetical protein